MSKTDVPGMCAQHAIITQDCRKGRGDDGAFEEAVRRLRREYEHAVKGWGDYPVNFHVVLTVERLPASGAAPER